MNLQEETPINLIDELLKLFSVSGVTEEYKQKFLSDRYIGIAFGKPPQLQQVFISSYFTREIIMLLDEVPDDIRYALASSGEVLEWLDVVKLIVFPFMIQSGLVPIKPEALNG
jgi:hypothetical protein